MTQRISGGDDVYSMISRASVSRRTGKVSFDAKSTDRSLGAKRSGASERSLNAAADNEEYQRFADYLAGYRDGQRDRLSGYDGLSGTDGLFGQVSGALDGTGSDSSALALYRLFSGGYGKLF